MNPHYPSLFKIFIRLRSYKKIRKFLHDFGITKSWQNKFIRLFKEQPNCTL